MNTPNFDMNALRSLVLGVELGGFSHAALRLNRSPSAVSMQLRKLETQAGQRLFKRNGRGLILTEAGELVLQHARRVLSINDEMALALGAITKGGTVRVGMPQDFAHTVLEDLLVQYAKVRPHTHVEVKAGRNYELAEDVASGRLDMALAFAPSGKGGDHRIATVPAVWIGKAGRLTRSFTEDIVPLIVFDGPCVFRELGIDALTQAGLPWRLAMTTPSLAGVWCGVRAGLGVTVRTVLAIPPDLSKIHSAVRLPALPSIDVVLYCVERRSPAIDEFRQLLLKIIKRQCRIDVRSKVRAEKSSLSHVATDAAGL